MHLIFSSLYQRISSPKRLAVWQLWHWAEYEGWIAATFPPCPVGRKEPICSLLFTHGGWNHSRAESAGCLALHCLVTSHDPKEKSKCLLKGFGTELISKNGNMKSLSRCTQPQDGSYILSPASPQSGDLCIFHLFQTPALPVSCQPDRILAIPTTGAQRGPASSPSGCPKSPRLNKRGQSWSLCQTGHISVQPQQHSPASIVTLLSDLLP